MLQGVWPACHSLATLANSPHQNPKPLLPPPPQIELEELRGLQREAARLRVVMPELSNLGAAMERVEVWQSRVRALTEMQAPLAELRELVEEAEGLPAAVPDVEAIRVRRLCGLWGGAGAAARQ